MPTQMEMDTRYEPKAAEQNWYRTWEERGYFRPRPGRTGRPFTISMPPPNITGELHMGHAMYTLQDALIRWHRMLGDETLWVPGTDHAALPTQNVIEKQLAAEGTSKEALGREAFEQRVQKWYAETGDTILRQMRRLGFSADWSRLRFTLDDAYCDAIRYVFVELWKQGLIYRGPRIVNWCPRDLSAISDLEVEYEETDDELYTLDYPVESGGVISVATARPETMVGDTAVAVHPEDRRYQHLVGRQAVLPLVHRRVPIIADTAVDPKFGTGAVKVTPGHDATDYEIGERHGLEVLNILHPDGRINLPQIPALDGLPVPEARRRIVDLLREEGAVAKVEPYRHSVGHCDRCGAVIEPMVTPQWWVRMKPLAEPAIRVVEDDQIRFHPEGVRERYLHWMRNIRDWCISRQIWLGHRIPVWTCGNGHVVAYRTDPKACVECGNTVLTQDPDVLDTWFSSALWPFATLGWPQETQDLRRYYPTQVLDTAREILYLWVARMIFMSLRFTGKIPFSDVLIHGTVLAADGRRMSKSLGNGVDPLDMVDRYGADATRAWCVSFGTTGQDIRFSEEKIKSYQNFSNKLWNITRLIVSRLHAGETLPPLEIAMEPADRWILGRLSAVTRKVTDSFERYQFGPAIDALYEFAWHEFADYYLELIKPRTQAGAGKGSEAPLAVAAHVLDQTLRLLHPIMPFVTEELWQRLPHRGETLMFASWPEPDTRFEDETLLRHMDHLLEVVRAIRNVRQDAQSGTGRAPAQLDSTHPLVREDVGRRYVATLAQLDLNGSGGTGPERRVVVGETSVILHLGVNGPDAGASRQLREELQKKENEMQWLQAKLANQDFLQNAPRDVVARERERLAKAERTVERLRNLLNKSNDEVR